MVKNFFFNSEAQPILNSENKDFWSALNRKIEDLNLVKNLSMLLVGNLIFIICAWDNDLTINFHKKKLYCPCAQDHRSNQSKLELKLDLGLFQVILFIYDNFSNESKFFKTQLCVCSYKKRPMIGLNAVDLLVCDHCRD